MHAWCLKYTLLFQNKAHHRSLENVQRTKPWGKNCLSIQAPTILKLFQKNNNVT
jgi:hypothetical protein